MNENSPKLYDIIIWYDKLIPILNKVQIVLKLKIVHTNIN